MPPVEARTPQGTTWRVRVLWAPRRRLLVRRFGGLRGTGNPFGGVELPDVSDGPDYEPLVRRPELLNQPRASSLGDSKLLLVLVIILLVAGGAIVWWVLLPLLLLVADGLVVAALVLVGLPVRLIRGGPWTVEATSTVPAKLDDRPDRPSRGTLFLAVRVPGWRAAHRRRDEIAARLAAGDPARKLGRVHLRD